MPHFPRASRFLKSDDRDILRLAIPAFFALVSEPLMVAADGIILGRVGKTELAGLAVASTVLGTVVGLCIFLAYGSTASVSRRLGSGDRASALRLALSSIWLAAGLGLVLSVLLALTAPWLAGLVASSAAVAAQGTEYLQISAGAVPAMLLVLAATGALRGLLDLRTPLLVTVVANAMNVILSVTFVHGFGMGIAGAAIGLVMAQWLAALWLCTLVILRARRNGSAVSPELSEILRAAIDGTPLLVRTALLRAAFVLLTVVAGHMGETQLAAFQIVSSVVTMLAFALDGIAIAGQTLTGNALGEHNAPRARSLTQRMIGWGIGSGLLGGLVTIALAPFIAQAFSPDPAVQQAAVPALIVVGLIQPLSGVVFVLDGVLIGAGDGAYLARAGVVQLAALVPVALLVSFTSTALVWLWLAYGVFQVARWATLWWRQREDAWMRLGTA